MLSRLFRCPKLSSKSFARFSVSLTSAFSRSAATATTPVANMPDRLLCMIPGPVEFHESVLAAAGAPAQSHVSTDFIAEFGEALEMMRSLFFCKAGQPLVLSGAGTLGWDVVAANLVEPGDEVLVLNTGYFGDRFGECFEAYGATVTHVRCPVGKATSISDLQEALKNAPNKYKLISVTHVDTSTGVLQDMKAISEVVRSLAPSALLCVDGVCSIGGELLDMDGWGVDVALTASQKAVGVPPGLCLVMLGPRSLDAFSKRQSKVLNYFADLKRWIPIHEAYEKRTGAYFSTPAVQLIKALNVSLKLILSEGLEKRFKAHIETSDRFKKAVVALGLQSVPDLSCAAHTMTALWLPAPLRLSNGGQGLSPFLAKMQAKGVQIAGGLHVDIRLDYFRIGHMNISATEERERGHVRAVLQALEATLIESSIPIQPGTAINAFDH